MASVAGAFRLREGAVPKGFVDGTHRLVDPRQTVERVRRLMPVLGITRVANVTGLDTLGIPTVSVYRPNSRSLAVAQGKGSSLAAAQASGLMEALEYHHAENADVPLRWASLDDLRFRHRVVETHQLAKSEGSLFHRRTRILWCEGIDLLNEESVWLPYELVHLDGTLPMPAGSGYFENSSNGLASGNHRLEAASHALCELVERDSYARFQAEDTPGQARRRLDLDTVDDDSCLWALDRYRRADVFVAVWDMTSEIGIPSFFCVVVDRRQGWRSVVASAGMGCHPTREVALLRALTEAAQSRLTSISGARDDLERRREEVLRGRDVLEEVRQDLQGEAPARSFRDVPSWQADTFDEDVAWLLERLRSFGIPRAIAVDLTHEVFGIPVVKLVTPGLHGIVHH